MDTQERETDIAGADALAEMETGDRGTLATLARAEINQQIATAKAYPRSIKAFMDEATRLATLDEEVAQSCIYVLPRAGKNIEGPSARFAELVAYSFRNLRYGARPINEDDEFVTSQGVCYDLERNNGTSIEVRRRITDSKGKRYNADMIGVTANAGNSVALRNALLKIVPKALWNPIYQRARRVVLGDFETFANRLQKALEAFQMYGVTKEMLLLKLTRAGVQDIQMDDLVILHGMLTALKDGDSSPEQMFADAPATVQQPRARVDTPPPAQQDQKEPSVEKTARRTKKDDAPKADATSAVPPVGEQQPPPSAGAAAPSSASATKNGTPKLTPNMLRQVKLRIESYNVNEVMLLKQFGVERLDDLLTTQVNDVLDYIEKQAT